MEIKRFSPLQEEATKYGLHVEQLFVYSHPVRVVIYIRGVEHNQTSWHENMKEFGEYISKKYEVNTMVVEKNTHYY